MKRGHAFTAAVLALALVALVAAWPFSFQPWGPGRAQAGSCDNSWGSVTGNWTDGTKWSLGHQPTSAENACITADGTYTVTISSPGVFQAYFPYASLTVGNSSGAIALVATGDPYAYLGNPGALTSLGTTVTFGIGNQVRTRGPLTNSGAINLCSTAPINCGLVIETGNLINNGTINFVSNNNSGQEQLSVEGGGATITNNGTINAVDDTGSKYMAIGCGSGCSSLTNSSTGTIVVAAGTQLRFSGIGVLDNFGTLTFQAGAAFNNLFTFHHRAGSTLTGTFYNNNAGVDLTLDPGSPPATFQLISGTLHGNVLAGQHIILLATTGGGNLNWQPPSQGATVSNAGTFDLCDAASRFTCLLNVLNSGSSGTLLNTGTINFNTGQPGHSPRLDAILDNQGLVRVDSAGAFFTRAGAAHSNTGTLVITPGSILTINPSQTLNQSGAGTITGGGTLDLETASLTGSGSITATLFNNGTVAPNGIFFVTGPYTQVAGGTLTIPIAGTTAGSSYSQLNATGAATLGGTLALQIAGGFTPNPGDCFDVLTFASSAGSFASLTGLGFPGGTLTPVLTGTSLSFEVDGEVCTGGEGGGGTTPALTCNTMTVVLLSGSAGSASTTCTGTNLATTAQHLGCSTPPAGLTCGSFSPASISKTSPSTTLTLNAPAGASPGTYHVTVNAGFPPVATSVGVTVSGPPDFSLTCNRTLFSMGVAPATATSNVTSASCTVTSILHYASPPTVVLSCGLGLPPGVGCSMIPNTINLTDNVAVPVTFQLTGAPFSPPTGADPTQWSFALIATGGTLSHSLSMRVSLVTCDPVPSSSVPSSGFSTTGDGIPDRWKQCGAVVPYTVGSTTTNVTLRLHMLQSIPQGVSPITQRTVYVQLDWMLGPPSGSPASYKLSPDAIKQVVDAFAAQNIKLYVDEGPDSIMDFATGQTWGDQSQAKAIPYQTNVGVVTNGVYDWTAFDTIKRQNFNPSARNSVAHYAISMHDYAGLTSSGLSRGGPASDFIISLGAFAFTTTQQAGTLMHELGHNLGLHHGGGGTLPDVDVNDKPNYLSIMNYLFQMTGILKNGQPVIDFSSAALDPLNEATLDQAKGLTFNGGTTLPDGTPLSAYGTYHYCNGTGYLPVTAGSAIPWGCSGGTTGTVSYDANGDGVCVTAGGSSLATTPTGDDAIVGTLIMDGGNLTCNTTARPGDKQTALANSRQIEPLNGFSDWGYIATHPLAVGQIGAGADTAPCLSSTTNDPQCFRPVAADLDDSPQTLASIKPAGTADVIPPVTAATASLAGGGSYTPGTWTMGPVTLALSAQDTGGSGAAQLNYLIGSGAWQTATGTTASVTVSALGITPVFFYAVDAAGNIETATQLLVQIAGTTPPATTASLSAQPNAAGWLQAGVQVTLVETDATSGATTYYALDDAGHACTPSTLGGCTVYGSTPISVSSDGRHTLTYFSIDQAGNAEAPRTQALNIDAHAPVTTATPAPAPNGAGVNTSPVTVTLSATDGSAGSGVQSIACSATGAQPITAAACTSPLLISAEGVTTLTFHATDVAGNVEADKTLTLTIHHIPPTLTLPAPITAEATGPSGATVTYTATAADAGGAALTPSCTPAAGATFPLGPTTVSCSATDANGLASSGSFTVTVRDTTAPTITGTPANITGVEATGPLGAVVTYTSPTASDLVDITDPVACVPVYGSTFALGATTVSCSAKDSAGNNAVPVSFTVTVVDTRPPTIVAATNVTAAATSGAGAAVTYTAPTAPDLVDGTDPVICSPASGTMFPIAVTTVTCTAHDSHGNAATPVSFTVTVTATTPPVITGTPGNQVVEATGPAGATVSYTPPTAKDFSGATVAVVCAPDSGSTFPLGPATVTCTAHDAYGNSASTGFSVTVRDTTPPILGSVPADTTITATSGTGATVTYTPPTATDLVDPAPTVTCMPASGSTFAPGPTTVSCKAKDATGNTSAPATFKVTVTDTVPTLTLPGPITREATSSAGATVTFAATATDIVDGTDPVSCTPASGASFPLGATTVHCSATNAAGQVASGTFAVTVQDTTPPVLTVPANLTTTATGPSGAVVSFSATATDVVDAHPVVTCTPSSGSTFAIGVTTVSCTVKDASGNVSPAQTFTVTVTAVQTGCCVSQGVAAGGTLANGALSAANPLHVAVTTPNAGTVAISTADTTGPPPAQSSVLGKQATITAPGATAALPLTFVFQLDPALLPLGAAAPTLQVLANGVPLAACTAGGQAAPSPCVTARSQLAGGVAQFSVLSTAGGSWSFGTPCVVCVLATRGGDALTVTGDAALAVTGGIVDDSSDKDGLSASGNATISAGSIGVVGGVKVSGKASIAPTAQTHIVAVADPLAGLPVPALIGRGQGDVTVTDHGSQTLNPGIYRRIRVGEGGRLTLNPGLYVITGELTLTSKDASISGTGVTLYLACAQYPAPCGPHDRDGDRDRDGANGATLSVTGGAHFTLTAPASGAYAGVAIFFDRGNKAPLRLAGRSADSITGSIYARWGEVHLAGDADAPRFRGLLVVGTLEVSGRAKLTVTFAPPQP